MTRLRPPLAALAATAVTAGSVLLFAHPAEACSCGSRRTLEEGLADGDVIAVLSRVDTDPKAHTVRLRVERTLDGTLPAEVTGRVGYPESCDVVVPLGSVTARLVERHEDGWQVAYCQFFDLGPTLQKMAGNPAATSRGPAVVLAAGEFGGARLATLDSAGDVVAWDGQPGYGAMAAVCPGAGTVVAVGRGPYISSPSGHEEAPAELTVHDARTLKVQRSVRLEVPGGHKVLGLRCRDAGGVRVDLLVKGDTVDGPTRVSLVNVRGAEVDARTLDTVTGGTATADGFLAVVGESSAGLVRLGPDGSRQVLVRLPDGRKWDEVWVSPDGTTAAVRGFSEATLMSSLVSVDLVSGEVLGDRTDDEGFDDAVWATPDRLMLWQSAFYDEGRISFLDRRFVTVTTQPARTGGILTAIGGQPVTFGGSRVTVHPASGPPRLVDELRLVGAAALVPLPALADHPFAPPVGLLPPKGETESPSTTWNVVPIVLAGGAAAAVGLAVLRWRKAKAVARPGDDGSLPARPVR